MLKKNKFAFTCPYCYEKHDPKRMYLRCAKQNCTNIIAKGKYDFIKIKKIKKCFHCKKGTLEFLCPNEHFGFSNGTEGVIPTDVRRAPNISVAVIGREGVGRTCYVGALLNELRYKVPRFLGIELHNADERSDRVYTECYSTPMFVKKQLPSVKKGLDGYALPICFYLSMFDSMRKKLKGSLTLNFSPTPSEILLNEGASEKWLATVQLFATNYIKNADTIFLIVDPMTIPYVSDQVMKRAQKLGELDSVMRCMPKDTDPYSTKKSLERIISILSDGDSSVDRVSTPIAIIFTKLDLIRRYYVPMSGSNRLRSDSNHLATRSFNMREHKITSEDIINLFVSHMGEDTVQLMRKFSSYSFFAVSSLGTFPSSDGEIPGGVKPERVVDPILWTLANKDLLEKSW